MALHQNVESITIFDSMYSSETPINMTRRGKENSRRIDLLEDRTTQDHLNDHEINSLETSLELRGKTCIRRDGRNNLMRVSK